MFKFFTNKNWYPWSIFGSIVILVSTWYQVQLDVMINQWFGEFYDTLQKALTTPNSVSEKEFTAESKMYNSKNEIVAFGNGIFKKSKISIDSIKD